MKEYYNKTETADILGVDTKTLDKLIESGQLKPAFSHDRTVRFHVDDISPHQAKRNAIADMINKGTQESIEKRIEQNDKFFADYREKHGFAHKNETQHILEKEQREREKKAKEQVEVTTALLNWMRVKRESFEHESEADTFSLCCSKHGALETFYAFQEKDNVFEIYANFEGYENIFELRKARDKFKNDLSEVTRKMNEQTQRAKEVAEIIQAVKKQLK